MNRKTMISNRELVLLEALKSNDIADAAKELKIQRGTADAMLSRVRDKFELARDTTNHEANLLKNARLAKILRRQE